MDNQIVKDGPEVTGGYKIRTIKDMFTVVKPGSLDCFLQDLRQVFEIYFKFNNEIPVLEEFNWIDDNENNINLNIKIWHPSHKYKDIIPNYDELTENEIYNIENKILTNTAMLNYIQYENKVDDMYNKLIKLGFTCIGQRTSLNELELKYYEFIDCLYNIKK